MYVRHFIELTDKTIEYWTKWTDEVVTCEPTFDVHCTIVPSCINFIPFCELVNARWNQWTAVAFLIRSPCLVHYLIVQVKGSMIMHCFWKLHFERNYYMAMRPLFQVLRSTVVFGRVLKMLGRVHNVLRKVLEVLVNVLDFYTKNWSKV